MEAGVPCGEGEDGGGLLSLMAAARDGALDRVRTILQTKQVDVNEVLDGRRAIDYSVGGEHHDVTLLLLQWDSIFPSPSYYSSERWNYNMEERRKRWKDLITRNGGLRDFFKHRDRLHKSLQEGKEEKDQELLVSNFLAEEERVVGRIQQNSRSRIFVNSDGESALYTATKNLKHNTWARMKSYCFSHATPEERKECIKITEDDVKFRGALWKYILPPNDLQVSMMCSKVQFLWSPEDDQVYYCNKVLKFFKALVSEPYTSILLQCLQHDPDLKIVFDCHSRDVSRLYHKTYKGQMFGAAELLLNTIYVVGGTWDGFDFTDAVGNLAHELTHMALHYIFGNMGLPYRRGNSKVEAEYEEIMKEVLSDKNLPKADRIIRRVADYEKGRQPYELIVRVMEMIGKYGKDGFNLLESQAPKLLSFFRQRVYPEMIAFKKRENKPVESVIHTDYHSNYIQVNRSDAASLVTRHNDLHILSVSNLKLGVSHLKASMKGITFVDWTKYQSNKSTFNMRVKRGEIRRLVIVWDKREGPLFCRNSSRCVNNGCIAWEVQEVIENTILLVLGNMSTLRKKATVQYSFNDLSPDTRKWVLAKPVSFFSKETYLGDLLESTVGKEKIGEHLAADFLSAMLDEDNVSLDWTLPEDQSNSLNKLGRLQPKPVLKNSIERKLRVDRVDFNLAFFESRANDLFFISGAETWDLEVDGFKNACVWNVQNVPDDARLFISDKTLTPAKDNLLKLASCCNGWHFAHFFKLIDKKYSHLHSIENKNITINKPCIIADAPGSGKTVHMRMEAMDKRKKQYFWVGVLTVPDLARKYETWDETSFSSGDKVVGCLFQLLEKSDSVIEEKLFRLFCSVEGKCFVYFDGFDEILYKFKEVFTLFLKSLVEHTGVKVYVTTRCSEAAYLERQLSTLAYSFVPLMREEQKKYLMCEWNNALYSIRDPDKRREKVEAIILGLESWHNVKICGGKFFELAQKLKTSLLEDNLKRIPNECFECLADQFISLWKTNAEGEVDFLGNPLHANMLASVAFQENFRRQGSRSLFKLYQRFVEIKIELYYLDFERQLPKRQSFHGNMEVSRHNAHKDLKEYASTCMLGIDSYPLHDWILGIGLVFKDGGSIKFVHQTFQEYFFFLWLIESSRKEEVTMLWLRQVLSGVKFQSFRGFIDGMLLHMYEVGREGEKEGSNWEKALISQKYFQSSGDDFRHSVRNCLFTSIQECHLGVLHFLVGSFKASLAKIIIDEPNEDIKSEEGLTLIPYQNGHRNALTYCGECVSRTLPIKYSGVRLSKVDYLKFLCELLKVVGRYSLKWELERFIRSQGFAWMGIVNFHLWRDESGKDRIDDILCWLRCNVSHDLLKEKLLVSEDCRKVVVNAAKCHLKLLVEFVESIVHPDKIASLLLEGGSLFGAWMDIVQKCRLDTVENMWEFVEGKLSTLEDKLGFLQRKNDNGANTLSAACLNRRHPRVLDFVWALHQTFMGIKESSDHFFSTFHVLEEKYVGDSMKIPGRCSFDYFSLPGFLHLLGDHLEVSLKKSKNWCHLNNEAKSRFVAAWSTSEKSPLLFYELQRVLKSYLKCGGCRVQMGDDLYPQLTVLCFENRRRGGIDYERMQEVIEEEFKGICASIESSPLSDLALPEWKGKPCSVLDHTKHGINGTNAKAYLILFERQVELELGIFGLEKVADRLKMQWENVCEKLPNSFVNSRTRGVKGFKALILYCLLSLLSKYLSKEQMYGILQEGDRLRQVKLGDPHASRILNSIENWCLKMDFKEGMIMDVKEQAIVYAKEQRKRTLPQEKSDRPVIMKHPRMI